MVKQKLDIGMFSCMYSQINGTAHSVRFLSEALAKTGHNVHVFAPRIEHNGHKYPKTLHFHELGGARVAPKTGFVISFPLHRYFLGKRESYLDILHIHTHFTVGSMAVNWAKSLGIPMIGTHNSPTHFYASQYVPVIGKILTKVDFLWRFERHVLDKYDFVHVATKSKKELLREYRFKEPIVTLSNGIHDLYYQDLKENGIREKYGLIDKKVLLYASRLSPEKHPLSVIKAFKMVHDEVPDAHLLLVGSPGPSTTQVERFIKRHKMDYVSYAGRVPFDDLLKLYNTADLTCLWSFIEAEGLVLIEAMAQGTPNVGANACGICDVIQHGKTGYLADNLMEFKDYVVKLLKDDDLREEMGKNAKKHAEDYRISKIANTWIDLYKFTRESMFPLKYYRKARKLRVNMLKSYIKNVPSVGF